MISMKKFTQNYNDREVYYSPIYGKVIEQWKVKKKSMQGKFEPFKKKTLHTTKRTKVRVRLSAMFTYLIQVNVQNLCQDNNNQVCWPVLFWFGEHCLWFYNWLLFIKTKTEKC